MLRTLVLSALLCAVHAVNFQIANKEQGPVWIGIQGNPGKENLRNGGFVLNTGASVTVTAPSDWAGRFWARTYCDPNTNHCLTGDCGNRLQCAGAGGNPPASLAEITLKGSGGLDYYDISLVDGFNVAVSMEPVGGTGDGGRYSCKRAGCLVHLNDNCPEALKLNSQYGTIGCKSACLAFNTDQYCCRNNYGTPDKCVASTWPVDYPAYFKSKCPDAYSYAYDDKKSTFTCKAENYYIQFGV